MKEPSPYRITSPEMGSYIEYRTGLVSDLYRNAPGELVVIEFPSTPDVIAAALEYAAGCPESRLLNIRTRLFRKIREVKP